MILEGSNTLTRVLLIGVKHEQVNQDVEREILNHSLLVHPHIVPIKEVFLSPGHLAVVMDHVPECNLPQVLEERRRLGGLKEHQVLNFADCHLAATMRIANLR